MLIEGIYFLDTQSSDYLLYFSILPWLVYCLKYFYSMMQYNIFFIPSIWLIFFLSLSIPHALEKKLHSILSGLPRQHSGREFAYKCRRWKRCGSISELRRSPGVRNGNLLQYSCLENSMDRGIWQATVHGVAKSRTRLSDWTFTHTRYIYIYNELY